MTTNSRQRAFARNVDFSFIVSGSERTFTFWESLNTLPTLAKLVRYKIINLLQNHYQNTFNIKRFRRVFEKLIENIVSEMLISKK